MKKAGSSNSKSKTPRTLKSSRKPSKSPKTSVKTRPNLSALAESLAVGHRPEDSLTPGDESRFRAFQSNLLSLVSHEIRTPLSAILNALTLLEDPQAGMSSAELVRMARQNSLRLQNTLAMLLDLAALESGTFHPRLKEVDLERIVAGRVTAQESLFKDRGIKVKQTVRDHGPLLGDPQKLSRAVDLCIQVLVPRAEEGSTLQLRISSAMVEFEFKLAPGLDDLWASSWSQALAGFEGGIGSPASAFSGGVFKGVLQSEQGFLTRMEEGLGSELILIHEILRMHQGTLTQTRGKDSSVCLKLELPEVSSSDGLKFVLSSRAFEVSTDLTSVALILIKIPANVKVGDFCTKLKANLFRSSDAVYPLPLEHQAALVLDDIPPKGISPLIERLRRKIEHPFTVGAAQCPTDSQDPGQLLDIARRNLESAK